MGREPSSRAGAECLQELRDADHSDAVLPHLEDQIEISLQVIIPGHKVFGAPGDRRFQEEVIVRISTSGHGPGDGDKDRPAGNQPKILNDLMLVDLVLALDAGALEHISDLFENWQAHDHVEETIDPGVLQLRRGAGWIEEGRHPHVRVNEDGDLHGDLP